MKQVLIIISIVVLSIGALVGLSFGMGWVGVSYTKTVGKAQQNANREVFEQSQSRVDAMREELSKYQLEYTEDTSGINRSAIRHMLLQDFASFDKSQLSYDQQQFLQSIQ